LIERVVSPTDCEVFGEFDERRSCIKWGYCIPRRHGFSEA